MDEGNTTGSQPGDVPKVKLSKEASPNTRPAPVSPQSAPLQPPPVASAPSGLPVPPPVQPSQSVSPEVSPPEGRSRGGPSRALAVALVGVAALAGIVWLAVGRGGSDADADGVLGDTTTQVVVPSSSAEVETSVDDSGLTQATSSTSVPPEPVSAPGHLAPTEVLASGGLPATTLRCNGETIDYSPARLIDGDLQTGWGVAGDGAGRSVTVRFPGPVELTQVGLTPGYAKVGPRADFDCQDVSAFDLNRVVVRASYRFDDGSEVEQSFEPRPEMQSRTVDVITNSVTITILETRLPPGADDDTVISEVAFEGRTA